MTEKKLNEGLLTHLKKSIANLELRILVNAQSVTDINLKDLESNEKNGLEILPPLKKEEIEKKNKVIAGCKKDIKKLVLIRSFVRKLPANDLRHLSNEISQHNIGELHTKLIEKVSMSQKTTPKFLSEVLIKPT